MREAEDIRKTTNGQAESEWTEEVKEEVMATRNMYDDLREKLREELRKHL